MNSFVKRTVFGVLYLAVMLAGLLLYDWLFAILFSVITLVMMREFYRMTCTEAVMKYIGNFAAFLGFCIFYVTFGSFVNPGNNPYGALCVALAVSFLLVAVISIVMSDKFGIRDTLPIYAGFVYIALPMSLSSAVMFHEGAFSGLLMLSFFIIIWASDVGAYCFGMLFGQKGGKKLCPAISPKKSWAGAWGGLFMAILAGIIMKYAGLIAFPLVHVIAMSAVMNILSVFGDLFESLWKRAAGIKDSGNVIPGHGGLMDRLDSALFAIPAGFIYLAVFGLV